MLNIFLYFREIDCCNRGPHNVFGMVINKIIFLFPCVVSVLLLIHALWNQDKMKLLFSILLCSFNVKINLLLCSFILATFHINIMVSSIFQEELYELILETNKHCVELCKPGASIRQIHNHSVSLFLIPFSIFERCNKVTITINPPNSFSF